MFGTSNFGTEVTSAPSCELRHEMFTSERFTYSKNQNVLKTVKQGQSMFGTSNFGTEVTSAPSCGLRNQMLNSTLSLVGMLTSAPCKRITCAEVDDLCRN